MNRGKKSSAFNQHSDRSSLLEPAIVKAKPRMYGVLGLTPMDEDVM
jgi:hypothetical protein